MSYTPQVGDYVYNQGMKRDAAFLNFRCFLRGVALRQPSEADYDNWATAEPEEGPTEEQQAKRDDDRVDRYRMEEDR